MSIDKVRGKSIVAAGHTTNYHEMGEGPPLIMLHGSGAGVSAWENWHLVMPTFAQRFRVIAPDIVGFGLTERPQDVKFSIKIWVQHLVGLMDALDIPQAAVVGNSFGGALVLATALSNPQRLSRLVLMGTPAGEFERVNRSSSWNYEPSIDSMKELLRGFPYDPSIVSDEMAQGRYDVSKRTDSRDAYRKLFPKPDETQATTKVRGIPAEDLERISHPVLVLHGREDSVVPMECGLRIATRCPNAQLHVFGKCGHWVQLEKQHDFTHLALHFLAAD